MALACRPALCANADEGLVVVGGDVGQFGDGVADPLQLR
jgi:hypothetical protein